MSVLPNLHPAVIHFPIALFVVAVAFDLAAFAFRRQAWLDRAAAVLYVLAGLGAGAAFLTGSLAEDSLEGVPPSAMRVMANHADWAFWSLIALSAFALVRAGVAWKDRHRDTTPRHPLRAVLLLSACFGVALLFKTAALGGALVFQHGVAVRMTKEAGSAATPTLPPIEAPRAKAPQADTGDAGPHEAHRITTTPATHPLTRGADGSVRFAPRSADAATLGTILVLAAGTHATAISAPTGAGRGLGLAVNGHAVLVLSETFRDVYVEAEFDVSAFEGGVGLVSGVVGDNVGIVFAVGRGTASLGRGIGAKAERLGKTPKSLPRGEVELALSVAGHHLKGMMDGKMVVHGHAKRGEGATGILLDGKGTVRLLSLSARPL